MVAIMKPNKVHEVMMEAIYFNPACSMSRGWWDLEVEVHLLFVGTGDNLVVFDG
jgi:hypothetical protein